MSLLAKVVNYIETELNFSKEELLFEAYYPDEPDKVVSVFPSLGDPPETYSTRRTKHIEIKVRANLYDEGDSLCEQVFNLFHSKENFYIDDVFVLHSYALTEMDYLYADEKGRHEFSFELAFYLQ